MGKKLKKLAKIAGGIMVVGAAGALTAEALNDRSYMAHTRKTEKKDWDSFFRVLTPQMLDRAGGFNWYD